MEQWVENLLQWYRKNKRDLPWRRTGDPYAIWISEIMLQQTKVETVIDYYNRFLEAFPNVFALGEAELDQVLKRWEGLGYYSRAKNLHKAAKMIVEKFQGVFPDTYEEIISLPGIGPYTVGAILGIAFNKSYPAIDGNVLRVMSRVLLIEEPIQEKRVQETIAKALQEDFPGNHASDFNQALMELGAMICIPKSPKCLLCPILNSCKAFKMQRQNELPVKKPKAEQKKVKRYIAIIEFEDKILMNKREDGGLLGGLWEFPGVEADNQKEFMAKFEATYGIPIEIRKHLIDTKHVFTHVIWNMKVYACEIENIEARLEGNLTWIHKNLLDEITIPTAFKKIKEIF